MSQKPFVDCGAGVRLERGVRLPMSDGTTLVSDHYYPPGGGQQPTLLMRQPYGRDIASTVVYAHPAFFARHGYNVVIQDVRGRGDSEGEFYPFRKEAKDGAETIALLRKRPESNGRFGMYGFSYQGMTQWLAAAEQPEGLQCIAPAQTAHNLYNGWFYSGGALRLASSLGWGLQMLKEDARRLQLRQESSLLERAWSSLATQFLTTPYGSHEALASELLPSYVRDWFSHPEPHAYWEELDISTRMKSINIPALHLSGWFDTYLRGSIDGFKAACEQSAANEHQYLLAGPWVHIPWGNRVGTANLGEEANMNTDAYLLRWFNHWLKDTGEFREEPRIKHFVLNENTWRNASTFSQPKHVLYLHSNGFANSSKGDGVLNTTSPEADEAPDLYNYDPEVPVQAPGGLANASGPQNQTAMELGNNLLCYTTAPLNEPWRLLGSATVRLYAAHSAPHTDFVAKLVDVSPSGDAMFFSIGICRSQRLYPETQPDQIELWEIKLDPISIFLARGHRLRLEIASSAWPLFDRNPNNSTPAHLIDSWLWERSTQIVHHSESFPSALHLPLVQENG